VYSGLQSKLRHLAKGVPDGIVDKIVTLLAARELTFPSREGGINNDRLITRPYGPEGQPVSLQADAAVNKPFIVVELGSIAM